MTRSGLTGIENLLEGEIAAFSVSAGLPAFTSVGKSCCTTARASSLVSIRTATGSHLIASLTHDFLVSTVTAGDHPDPELDTEVIPAGHLDIGQKLCVIDRSGTIIEDPIIDIEPVVGDRSMCRFDYPQDCFPVIFAGGLGILSG